MNNNENIHKELQLLRATMVFLDRTELKGNEVNTFNAIIEYINEKANNLNEQLIPEHNTEI